MHSRMEFGKKYQLPWQLSSVVEFSYPILHLHSADPFKLKQLEWMSEQKSVCSHSSISVSQLMPFHPRKQEHSPVLSRQSTVFSITHEQGFEHSYPKKVLLQAVKKTGKE
jgi:hypothetical protein